MLGLIAALCLTAQPAEGRAHETIVVLLEARAELAGETRQLAQALDSTLDAAKLVQRTPDDAKFAERSLDEQMKRACNIGRSASGDWVVWLMTPLPGVIMLQAVGLSSPPLARTLDVRRLAGWPEALALAFRELVAATQPLATPEPPTPPEQTVPLETAAPAGVKSPLAATPPFVMADMIVSEPSSSFAAWGGVSGESGLGTHVGASGALAASVGFEGPLFRPSWRYVVSGAARFGVGGGRDDTDVSYWSPRLAAGIAKRFSVGRVDLGPRLQMMLGWQQFTVRDADATTIRPHLLDAGAEVLLDLIVRITPVWALMVSPYVSWHPTVIDIRRRSDGASVYTSVQAAAGLTLAIYLPWGREVEASPTARTW